MGQRLAQPTEITKSFQQELADAERQVDHLPDRLVDASNPRAVRACESKIENLERQEIALAGKLKSATMPEHAVGELFEAAMRFLSRPWKVEDSGRLDICRLVLRLAVPKRPAYCRKEGFRTLKIAFAFKALSGVLNGKPRMARFEGETSNAIFDVLADWNAQLEHSETAEFTQSDNAPQGPELEGPEL